MVRSLPVKSSTSPADSLRDSVPFFIFCSLLYHATPNAAIAVTHAPSPNVRGLIKEVAPLAAVPIDDSPLVAPLALVPSVATCVVKLRVGSKALLIQLKALLPTSAILLKELQKPPAIFNTPLTAVPHSANLAIDCICSSLKLLSASATLLSPSANFSTKGVNASPTLMRLFFNSLNAFCILYADVLVTVSNASFVAPVLLESSFIVSPRVPTSVLSKPKAPCKASLELNISFKPTPLSLEYSCSIFNTSPVLAPSACNSWNDLPVLFLIISATLEPLSPNSSNKRSNMVLPSAVLIPCLVSITKDPATSSYDTPILLAIGIIFPMF